VERDEANTMVAHEATEVHYPMQIVLMFVMVLTVLLVTVKPMLERVGERGMYSTIGAEFVEGVSRVQVRLE
jgi:hypothetical protein